MNISANSHDTLRPAVACVKWGGLYPACFVNLLHAMVKRNLEGVAFDFVCFTEDTDGLLADIQIKPLPAGLQGWWNKLALFQAGVFATGQRVIYLDLDTVITGSLIPLLNYKGDFAILRDFYRLDGFGSGVMLWRAGACDALWTAYVAAGRPALAGGDQAWIEQNYKNADLLQAVFPGLFASFKVDCQHGLPPSTAVVAFHGEPKQDNCDAPWVKTFWQGEAIAACARDISQDYLSQAVKLRALIGAGLTREAIALSETFKPQSGDYETLHLFGVIAQLRGDYLRARMRYEEVLAREPGYTFSQLALSQLLMQQTKFQEGRDLYEARFEALTEASGPDWRGLPYPRWHGESLENKKLYLWAEQGLGDIVMFAAFLPQLLAQSPARIVLGMFPKLISLFARSFPMIEVEDIERAGMHALAPAMLESFPQIEKLAEQTKLPFELEPLRAAYETAKTGLFDLAAPLGDTLVYCMPEGEPAEQSQPYLIADPARVAAIQEQFKGKRIGVAFATTNKREATRNLPLEALAPLLQLSAFQFVSLQHGVAKEDISLFNAQNGCNLQLSDIDLLQDAEGLAALIAAMDIVITIDNSVAHLAGALGIKTCLLLPKGCNFRWPMLPNGKTLWYRSVTIFQQETLFEWADAVKKAIHQTKLHKTVTFS